MGNSGGTDWPGGIGAESRESLAKIIKDTKGIITPVEVARILGVDRQEAGGILSRWNRTGWVRRIKRGVYIPVLGHDPNLATIDPWVFAEKVYGPGYLGGFSAVKYWDLSEQVFETVYFFVREQPKEQEPKLEGMRIHLKTIKKDKFFGTKTMWLENTKLQVSDPSKTIVDFLDDPKLSGGMRVVRDIFREYLKSEYRNIDLLIQYAEKIGNKTAVKRLGLLMELEGLGQTVEPLKKQISKGYSLFDPTVENKKIVTKWALKVPTNWKAEYDRKR